jgi:hypothetical protein
MGGASPLRLGRGDAIAPTVNVLAQDFEAIEDATPSHRPPAAPPWPQHVAIAAIAGEELIPALP